MFSEYASRFLAQSQSRISFASPQDQLHRATGKSRYQPLSQTNAQRTSFMTKPFGNSASGLGQLSLGYRKSQCAPLLQDATDKDIEEGEEDEHEREVADYFALQRSRKHFVHSHLEGSSEVEEQDFHTTETRAGGIGRPDLWRHDDIKSSWQNEQRQTYLHGSHDSTLFEEVRKESDNARRGNNQNIEDSEEVMKSITLGPENQSEALNAYELSDPGSRVTNPPPAPHSIDSLRKDRHLPDGSSSISECPAGVDLGKSDITYNDPLWRQVYIFTMAAFLTSFVLVWLHVSIPTRHRLGESVYGTLTASYKILAVDTLVAVIVSMLWLAILRLYVRLLVYTVILGFPLVLFASSIYSFVFSFQASSEISTVQMGLMRWLSVVPFVAGGLWLYGIYISRHSFRRATGLLELAVKILASNPLLIGVGFVALVTTMVWSWIWIALFTRIFLGGHFNRELFFIVDIGSWWLGSFYILTYLWTLGIISGVQRVIIAATVSQWYFHRHAMPAVAADAVVRAASSHALTNCFGTICLSNLIAVLVRLPILVLPRRIMAIAGIFSTVLVPESLRVLTYPITLTHAAIHNQSLGNATRAVLRCSYVQGTKHGKVTFPQRGRGRSDSTPSVCETWSHHRLALQLLYATRTTASLAFGFGAWIHASQLSLDQNMTNTVQQKGLYSYVVGLLAGAIGWAITGALEGVLTAVVDAIIVCWECEISTGGLARYCREANELLGDSNMVRHGDGEGFGAILHA